MDPISVPGTLDSLPAIGRYVVAAAKEAGLDKTASYRLRLAVDELATNSIVHGYEEQGLSGDLDVRADITDQTLTITIEDTGPAYDPRSTAPPDTLDTALEDRPIGGLGVYLTLRGVDQFLYERDDNRNRNIFVVNRPQAAGVDDAPGPAMENRRILLTVDDSAIIRTLLANQLKRLGYFVREAGTGQQTLDALKRQKFDLLLLDASLADSKSEDILRAVKSDPATRSVAVVMLALPDQVTANELEQFITQGADDYILLPRPTSKDGASGASAAQIEHYSPALFTARVAATLELRRLREMERAESSRMLKLAQDLHQVILPLGMALSEEKNMDRLLEQIFDKARDLCRAEAGTLYRASSAALEPVIAYNNAPKTGQPLDAKSLPTLSLNGQSDPRSPAAHVAATRQTLNIIDVYADVSPYTEALKESDKQRGYKSVSAIATPLVDSRADLIGVMELVNPRDAAGDIVPFDGHDQLVLESLASQATVALNNQLLRRREEQLLIVERDVQVGRDMQQRFLPATLPQPPGWEIVACFHPAREVAGDWYDAFQLPHNRIGLVIADVCDKGVGAALFMSLMRSLIRAFSQQNFSLGWTDVLSNLSAVSGVKSGAQPPLQSKKRLPAPGTTALQNAIMLTNNYVAKTHLDMNMFATLFFGVLDPATGLLLYVNGGHMPPAIIGPEGIKQRLKPTGPAVGMMPDATFEIQEARIEPGDILYTYSDGVTDARDPNRKLFGEKRLVELLSTPAASAGELQERVDRALQAHIATAPQFDDITMLTVYRGAAAS